MLEPCVGKLPACTLLGFDQYCYRACKWSVNKSLHWFDRGLRMDLTNCNPTYIPFLFILCCVRKSVVNAFCLKTDVFRFIGVNILVRQYSLQQMILELYSKTRLFPFNEQTFIWFHLVCSHHYADIILIRSN